MKRFYKTVEVNSQPHGFQILLDGKPVKTPGRATLLLPTRALADGVAGEWRAQVGDIVPVSMPLLRLANTVLDGIAATHDEVVTAILRFGEHDLLFYRAEEPGLAARQAAAWDGLLDWAASRYGVTFTVGTGVGHLDQPPQSLARLRQAVADHDDFALAALHVLASITGSLVLALAVSDGKLDAAKAFELSRQDEDHQAERWGRDAEATARANALAAEMASASVFLAASRD